MCPGVQEAGLVTGEGLLAQGDRLRGGRFNKYFW